MLDIHFIRENKELVKEAAQKKHVIFDVDALITLDDKRLSLARAVEDKRALQNKASEEISRNEGSRDALISKMQTLKSEMEKEEEELKLVMGEWRNMMLQVPNIPDVSVAPSLSMLVKFLSRFVTGRFNKIINGHAEQFKCILVDIYTGSKIYGRKYAELISADGLHPSDKGYALWANAIIDHL